MSELTDVFDEVLAARSEVNGGPETVSFRNRNCEALIGSQSDDLQPGGGGWSDETAMRVSVRLADAIHDGEQAIGLEPITVRGKSLMVLIPQPREGRMDLIVGDPAAEDD